jgi:hypothetical protein
MSAWHEVCLNLDKIFVLSRLNVIAFSIV